MSVDEILASNLWPWPDPLLKRDQAGNVLFVNAAFLQLYGGQVHDWSGKPLAGWPAPVRAGAQRFETRAGIAPEENVFDWVESAMADGNALAIARNVTVFMTPPTPPAEEIITAPAQVQAQAQASVQTPVQAQEKTAPPTPTPAPQQEPISPGPSLKAPEIETSTQQQAPDLSSEFEDTLNKRADEYTYDDSKTVSVPPQGTNNAPPVTEQISAATPVPAHVQQAPDQTPQAQPPAAPSPEPQPREESRMFERRALPIKDSTSVLGSNWRDQVIAKAVGGSAPEEESTPSAVGYDSQDDSQDTPSKAGTGLHILLAEDNAINALLTRTLLEAEGAEVDTVEDGALALEAVGKKKYDLIFMDMRMPNMDGLEATRKIRAFGSTMPIIALTANAFDDDRNACFDSGMNDFMTKPVSAEELSEMVINWTKSDEDKKLAS